MVSVAHERWVARVDAARYQAACAWAWRTAAGTGGPAAGPAWPDDLADVPHDLADLWDETATPLGERLELALRLYREMPCYAHLLHLAHHVETFGPGERQRFWDALRSALDSPDDRLADPVAYALWADHFEDPARVAEAWRESSRRDRDPWTRRLRRVLGVTGPVPWHLKAPVLDDLADDVSWHPAIVEALLASLLLTPDAMQARCTSPTTGSRCSMSTSRSRTRRCWRPSTRSAPPGDRHFRVGLRRWCPTTSTTRPGRLTPDASLGRAHASPPGRSRAPSSSTSPATSTTP